MTEMKVVELGHLTIIPVKCDCCGEMTRSFSDKSSWFGKYLKPNEEKICRNCIKTRDGYAEEFLEKFGISVEGLND